MNLTDKIFGYLKASGLEKVNMQAYLKQLERLKLALQIDSDTAFSQILDVSQGAVSGAKKRGQIPYSWFFTVHEKTGILIDWLYSGRGAMLPDDPVGEAGQQEVKMETVLNVPRPCERCIKLESELDIEKAERRVLSNENRRLWKENGILRERCATLEERQKHCGPDGGFTKHIGILSSKVSICD